MPLSDYVKFDLSTGPSDNGTLACELELNMADGCPKALRAALNDRDSCKMTRTMIMDSLDIDAIENAVKAGHMPPDTIILSLFYVDMMKGFGQATDFIIATGTRLDIDEVQIINGLYQLWDAIDQMGRKLFSEVTEDDQARHFTEKGSPMRAVGELMSIRERMQNATAAEKREAIKKAIEKIESETGEKVKVHNVEV